jgi:hypothetical protein
MEIPLMTMSFTRLLQLSLLALPLAFAAASAPASATSGRLVAPEASSPSFTEPVQYERRRERRRRCWTENRRVRVEDRRGRLHTQIRPVRICR